MDLATFTQTAAMCAPSVHVETLAAIARTESRFNKLAIGDNTAKRSYSPRDLPEAIRIATDLVVRQRHSVDLGLMQINSANLPGLRMSIADTFEPCKAMRAGARVLIDGYRPPAAGQDAQPALVRALSHYNTGDAQRGVRNGYVGRVFASAQVVVPAIRLGPQAQTQQFAPTPADEPPPAPPPPPPTWDVYRRAAAARLTPPSPPPATVGPEAPDDPPPVRLRATPVQE